MQLFIEQWHFLYHVADPLPQFLGLVILPWLSWLRIVRQHSIPWRSSQGHGFDTQSMHNADKMCILNVLALDKSACQACKCKYHGKNQLVTL